MKGEPHKPAAGVRAKCAVLPRSAFAWLMGTRRPCSRLEDIAISAVTQAPILVLAWYLGRMGWPL